MKDRLGTEIEVGDTVAYAVKNGSTVHLGVGVVQSVAVVDKSWDRPEITSQGRVWPAEHHARFESVIKVKRIHNQYSWESEGISTLRFPDRIAVVSKAVLDLEDKV